MAKRIYVGSLPYSVDDTQLEDDFEDFENVAGVETSCLIGEKTLKSQQLKAPLRGALQNLAEFEAASRSRQRFEMRSASSDFDRPE